ncbi:hypothetical protein [Helicobacter sp. 23-1045]
MQNLNAKRGDSQNLSAKNGAIRRICFVFSQLLAKIGRFSQNLSANKGRFAESALFSRYFNFLLF